MFKQDFVMQQIEMVVQFLLKLLFKRDSLPELLPEVTADYGALLGRLNRLVDSGKIGAAEDLLFQNRDGDDLGYLRLALVFYGGLNERTDSFLEQNGFSRAEIAQGLRDIAAGYGVDAPGLYLGDY